MGLDRQLVLAVKIELQNGDKVILATIYCPNKNPSLTLSYLGDSAPLMFFFHHPETAQAMKRKLSDFKDTFLRHILQVIPGVTMETKLQRYLAKFESIEK